MRITNDLNLPLPIVKAVENDPYDNGGTLSATTLIKPAQAVVLERRHHDEIVEDASDRIWSLMGQIGHLVVERAANGLDPAEYIPERRYYMETQHMLPSFDPVTGAIGPETAQRLSGAADLVHIPSGTVYDFKFTSGWAVMDAMKGGKNEWRYQLSMLAMMARGGLYMEQVEDAFGLKTWVDRAAPPIDIKRGRIVAIVRDWTKGNAAKNPDWPQKAIQVIDMNIMSDEETMAWVDQRVEGLKWAMHGGDTPCTDEERWHRPGKWAVTKAGNQKATKLADSELELSAWIATNRGKVGNNYEIAQRPGVYARCADYCAAAAHCPQHQAHLEANQGEEE